MLNKACFVDARFKNMHVNEQKALHEDVIEEMISLMPLAETAAEGDIATQSHNEQEPCKKKRKSLLGQLLGDMFEKSEKGAGSQGTCQTAKEKTEKAEKELKRYIDEESPAVDDISALKWSKEHHSRFPTIAKLAKKLLCIPATSTPSERLFSTAGYVINSKRACLDADNVNMLCFLAENLP